MTSSFESSLLSCHLHEQTDMSSSVFIAKWKYPKRISCSLHNAIPFTLCHCMSGHGSLSSLSLSLLLTLLVHFWNFVGWFAISIRCAFIFIGVSLASKKKRNISKALTLWCQYMSRRLNVLLYTKYHFNKVVWFQALTLSVCVYREHLSNKQHREEKNNKIKKEK